MIVNSSLTCKLQCLGLSPIELIHREVDFVDIAYDEISAKHYKEEEVGSQNLK